MNPANVEGIFLQAWTSQFEKPTFKVLQDQLDPEAQVFYKKIRSSIVAALGKKPKLEWMGITWHWCEHTKPDPSGMLQSIHLIPDPQSPRVALTLSTTFFSTNPPSSLPKHLHSGLSTATAIGHQTWCEFPLNSQEAIDSVETLFKLAHGV